MSDKEERDRKERSLLRELGKAYASVPREGAKAIKRMAKNFNEGVIKEAPDIIRELPEDIANIKQVKNFVEMVKDPLNLKSDLEKLGVKFSDEVKAGRKSGARGKSRTRRADGGTEDSKFPDLTGDGKVTQADILKGRKVFQDGGNTLMMPEEGMPVDTYPNIPPEEMEEVMASQLPDDEMEEDYIKFVMDESLDDSEQDYLAEVLTRDERLSDILDKVITTASEFSGAGEVDGPGTGVSDSIPARLSDGEFVFTKKATDQMGADNLQRMMDDAERAYDGGLQQMNIGGMPRQEEEELEEGRFDMGKTDEEIKKLMIGANKMPSVQ